MRNMKLTITTRRNWLFFLFVSFYVVVAYCFPHRSILSIGAVFLVAVLLFVAAKTTVVTSITLLVLLTFAGNRRRSVVLESRKIVADVALYLFKRKRVFAFGCAMIMSLVWPRLARDNLLHFLG